MEMFKEKIRRSVDQELAIRRIRQGVGNKEDQTRSWK